ncbi:MAG TPA: hypothetical protein DCR93_24625 [Cytophagales bacterium]|nr:hypothetical protein [Cytophagales bacterium]
MAQNMGLGSTGWVLLASDAYQQIMRDDNELNNNMGWSIYNNGDADSDFKANHVFIKNGKFYFYGVSDSEVNYDHYSVNEIAKRILTSFWNNAKNRRSGIGYDTDGLQADLRYYWQKEMPSNTKLRLDYENDPAAYALTGITSQDYQKTWSGVYNLVKDTLFVRSTKGVAIRVRQLVLENVPNRKAAFNGINNGHDLEGLAQDIRYYLGECLPPGSGHSYNNNWVSSAALAAARMDQDDLWQNIYNLVDHNMGTKFWI